MTFKVKDSYNWEKFRLKFCNRKISEIAKFEKVLYSGKVHLIHVRLYSDQIKFRKPSCEKRNSRGKIQSN